MEEQGQNNLRPRLQTIEVEETPEVQVITPPEPVQDQPQKHKKKLIIFALIFIILLVLAIGGIFFLTRQTTHQTTVTPIPIGSEQASSVNVLTTSYDFALGYQIKIENGLNVRTIDDSEEHGYLELCPDSREYAIEVEAFSHTLKDWKKLSFSELLVSEDQQTQKINGFDVEIEKGGENFAQSKRKYVLGKWKDNEKTLIIRVFSESGETANSVFNKFAAGVSISDKKKETTVEQTGLKTAIKYPDGIEVLKDLEKSDDIMVGEYEVGFIIEHPNPIVIVDDNTISSPKLGTLNLYARVGNSLYKPTIESNNYFELATETVGVKVVRLSANKVLVTPKDSLFPAKKQFFIGGIGSRFFTQEKLIPPDMPIIANLLSDYSGDFEELEGAHDIPAIRPLYFLWKDEKGDFDVFGASVFYRKGNASDELVEKYKKYFEGKGYSLNEKNTYKGKSISGASTRKIVGLESSTTICKIVWDNTLNILCGNPLSLKSL